MRGRWLVNAVLLLAVLGLAAVAVRERGPEPPEAQRVTGLDPAEVMRVIVRRDGEPAIELERDHGRWAMRAPYPVPANAYRVEALLGVLAASSHTGFRAAGNDLAEFGLDPPRASLEIDGSVLLFGATEPLDGRRYVLHDDQVHLVTDAWFQHLGAPTGAYVDPSPIGTGAEPITVRLAGGISLARDDGRWRVEPPGALGGAHAAEGVAAAWRSAQALRVEPFDPGRDWRPAATVTVDGGTDPFVLEAAGSGADLVLGRRAAGVEYHFPAAVAERLLRARPRPGAG